MSKNFFISVIVPTIGRPTSLNALLQSLCLQSRLPDEIIIADGSSTDDIDKLILEGQWHNKGLLVKRIVVSPPNAVRQRNAAIDFSVGDFLLFLDDDVVLEPECLDELLRI